MTRVIAAFLFLVVIFGTTFGAIKIGIIDGWPSFLAAGVRFACSGLLVLAVAKLTGHIKPLAVADWRGAASVGVSVTAITFGTLYNAERVLPSGIAALLSATGPLFAVTLAIAAKQRRFDFAIVAGILSATIGVLLISGAGAIQGTPAMLASAAIVVSELAFAWGLGRANALRASIPSLQLAGLQQLIGGVVLLLLSITIEHRAPVRLEGAGLMALLYLIVIGSATAHSISIWLAGVTSATFASSWTYISPFIALLFGAAYLHEIPGAAAWFGGILVIAGAIVLNRDVAATLRAARTGRFNGTTAGTLQP